MTDAPDSGRIVRDPQTGTLIVDGAEPTLAASGPPVPPPPSADRSNMAWLALAGLGVIGIVAGLILILVGVSNAAHYDPALHSFHRDNGVVETLLGSFALGVGLTSGLLLLAVTAVMRHIDLSRA